MMIRTFFIKRNDEGIIILAIYVDDALVASIDLKLILSLRNLHEKEFEMSYQGELKYLLGLQIERNKQEGWLKISQPKYLGETLCRYKMETCKPKSTPFEARLVLTKIDSVQINDNDHDQSSPYSHAVGSLMHIVINSRLDACFSVSCLAQYR